MFRVFSTAAAARVYCAEISARAGLPQCECDGGRTGGEFPPCTCDHAALIFDPECPYLSLNVSEAMLLASGGYAVSVPDEYREAGVSYVEYAELEWPRVVP